MKAKKLEQFVDVIPNGEYQKSDREVDKKLKVLPVILKISFYTKMCLYFIE